MKKGFILVLALIYLNIASGVVMNIHYCMGQLASIEYGFSHHDKCGMCGMEENEGCCDTEFKVVKIQDSHQWTSLAWQPGNAFTPFVVNIHQEASISPNDSPRIIPNNSPPGGRLNSIYLHNCVFRI